MNVVGYPSIRLGVRAGDERVVEAICEVALLDHSAGADVVPHRSAAGYESRREAPCIVVLPNEADVLARRDVAKPEILMTLAAEVERVREGLADTDLKIE